MNQLTREQYDALDAINWSRLRLLERSPAHFKAGYADDDAGHFRLGTAAHSAVLEPDKFLTDFTVYPGKVRRGKEWEAFEAEALQAGKQVITKTEHAEACAIQRAVRGHAVGSGYFQNGLPEVAMTWKLGAFACKGRADWIGECLVDLKSTRSSHPKEFARSCYKYGYFGQAAWYVDGYFLATGIRKPFVFVAVESSAPYIVTVFTVPEHVMDFGREQYLNLLGRLDYCTKSNWWGGYTEQDQVELELPAYSVQLLEEQT